MIKLQTNHGDITIELDTAKAPETAANFTQYVKDGHYDNTIFHRGFEPGMKQKSARAPIKNEAQNGLTNNHYTVAMARTSDPHSASTQFFINTKDNDFLNHSAPTAQGWGYCVFGKVTAGTEVVDKIGKVKTSKNGLHQDVPVDDVVIQKATVI